MLLACAALMGMVTVLSGCGGSIDYELSVKAWMPFLNSQGLDGTVGQVVNKYISSGKWNAVETGDRKATVTVNGKITADGKQRDIMLVFGVSPGSTSDSLSFMLSSATLDKETIKGNDATEFLLMMFHAYNEGIDNLDDLN